MSNPYITQVQHKYSVGDKVRVTNHRYNSAEGEIHAPIPYTFVAPGYYVRIGDSVVAVSERSLERIDDGTSSK